jgi:hypothetical protein
VNVFIPDSAAPVRSITISEKLSDNATFAYRCFGYYFGY